MAFGTFCLDSGNYSDMSKILGSRIFSNAGITAAISAGAVRENGDSGGCVQGY